MFHCFLPRSRFSILYYQQSPRGNWWDTSIFHNTNFYIYRCSSRIQFFQFILIFSCILPSKRQIVFLKLGKNTKRHPPLALNHFSSDLPNRPSCPATRIKFPNQERSHAKRIPYKMKLGRARATRRQKPRRKVKRAPFVTRGRKLRGKSRGNPRKLLVLG